MQKPNSLLSLVFNPPVPRFERIQSDKLSHTIEPLYSLNFDRDLRLPAMLRPDRSYPSLLVNRGGALTVEDFTESLLLHGFVGLAFLKFSETGSQVSQTLPRHLLKDLSLIDSLLTLSFVITFYWRLKGIELL